MKVFKIGDRVKLLEDHELFTDETHQQTVTLEAGLLGVVVDDDDDACKYDEVPGPYRVKWDNGTESAHFDEDIQHATELTGTPATLADVYQPADAPAVDGVANAQNWQQAYDGLAFYEATKDADLDDRNYWWRVTGQHWPDGKEPSPRTNLKPDTLKVWPIMFRNSALIGAYDCDGNVGPKLDMLDALDVIATQQAELARAREQLAAAQAANNDLRGTLSYVLATVDMWGSDSVALVEMREQVVKALQVTSE